MADGRRTRRLGGDTVWSRNRFVRRKQRDAAGTQARVRSDGAISRKPSRERRFGCGVSPSAQAIRGFGKRVPEAVMRERLDDDPRRIRGVARLGRQRREHVAAVRALPELHQLKLLLPPSLSHQLLAAAVRARDRVLARRRVEASGSRGHTMSGYAECTACCAACHGFGTVCAVRGGTYLKRAGRGNWTLRASRIWQRHCGSWRAVVGLGAFGSTGARCSPLPW